MAHPSTDVILKLGSNRFPDVVWEENGRSWFNERGRNDKTHIALRW